LINPKKQLKIKTGIIYDPIKSTTWPVELVDSEVANFSIIPDNSSIPFPSIENADRQVLIQIPKVKKSL